MSPKKLKISCNDKGRKTLHNNQSVVHRKHTNKISVYIRIYIHTSKACIYLCTCMSLMYIRQKYTVLYTTCHYHEDGSTVQQLLPSVKLKHNYRTRARTYVLITSATITDWLLH